MSWLPRNYKKGSYGGLFICRLQTAILKPMTNQQKKPSVKDPDTQNYTGVGITFFVVGIALFATEATRMVGLPFFVLGITFMALGQQKPSKKSKK